MCIILNENGININAENLDRILFVRILFLRFDYISIVFVPNNITSNESKVPISIWPCQYLDGSKILLCFSLRY